MRDLLVLSISSRYVSKARIKFRKFEWRSIHGSEDSVEGEVEWSGVCSAYAEQTDLCRFGMALGVNFKT